MKQNKYTYKHAGRVPHSQLKALFLKNDKTKLDYPNKNSLNTFTAGCIDNHGHSFGYFHLSCNSMKILTTKICINMGNE